MTKLLFQDNYIPLIAALIVALIIAIALVIISKIVVDNRVRYTKKDALLTRLEKQYYEVLSDILTPNYVLLPQINLASVIDKDSSGFRTELFRNIDFGVFDHDLCPLLLIEINDNSHLREDRRERDKSVAKICKKAKLPLVTFWTDDGINRDAMAKVLKKFL